MKELIELTVLVQILTRALVASKVLNKEYLLAELSRVNRDLPAHMSADIQSLILGLPDQ